MRMDPRRKYRRLFISILIAVCSYKLITSSRESSESRARYIQRELSYNSRMKRSSSLWSQAVSEFSRHSNSFHNKADFEAWAILFDFMKDKRERYCSKENVVLVSGTFEGDLVEIFLRFCPSFSLYGFEIQEHPRNFTKARFESYPNTKILSTGISEFEAQNERLGGVAGKAGLYSSDQENGIVISTTYYEKFCDDRGIDKVLFTVIDVEGHEPKVIRGMHLEKERNQKRFAHFQFELGDAWALNDPRHGRDAWSLALTIGELEKYGYEMFLVGTNGWIQVDSSFFENGVGLKKNNGHGMFVPGNVLAIHSIYADQGVQRFIKLCSEKIQEEIFRKLRRNNN